MDKPKPSFFSALVSYLLSAWSVLTSIILAIMVLADVIAYGGYLVNTEVHHSYLGALYLSCITALTIGYGDMIPYGHVSKIAAVVTGILGILFAGIVVAASINALRDSR